MFLTEIGSPIFTMWPVIILILMLTGAYKSIQNHFEEIIVRHRLKHPVIILLIVATILLLGFIWIKFFFNFNAPIFVYIAEATIETTLALSLIFAFASGAVWRKNHEAEEETEVSE